MSFFERLEFVFKESGLPTIREFMASLGYDESYWRSLRSRKQEHPSEKMTGVVEEKYGIRKEWFRYGTGPRYTDEEKNIVLEQELRELAEFVFNDPEARELVESLRQMRNRPDYNRIMESILNLLAVRGRL